MQEPDVRGADGEDRPIGQLQWRDWGAGSPIVILNGVCSRHDDLDILAQGLVPGYRVLVPSMPGYGDSPAAPRPYDFHSVNRRIAADLLARGVRNAVLVGHSLGAVRAIDLACGSGVEVAGLFLLGGAAAWNDDARQGYVQLAQLLRSRQVPRGLLPSILLSSRHLEAHADAAQEVERFVATLDMDAMADELEALAGLADMLDRVASLDCPIHARVGSEDRSCPPPCSEAIVAAARHGVLEVVQSTGHLQHWEDPAGVRQSLRAFLAQLTTERG